MNLGRESELVHWGSKARFSEYLLLEIFSGADFLHFCLFVLCPKTFMPDIHLIIDVYVCVWGRRRAVGGKGVIAK